MKGLTILGIVTAGVLAAVLLPIMPDPYYHKERMPLLLWIAREIEEFYTGERE